MNILFLGASGGMGQELCRALLADGHRLVLLGRDPQKLQASFGAVAGAVACDLADVREVAAAVTRAAGLFSKVDMAIVAAGAFAEQEVFEEDRDARLQMLETNFRGTIEFCEAARPHLLQDGGGILCIYTSVAAVRARAKVALYGATKAGLDYYLDAIGQRYQDQGLHVLRVRPGFVKTAMTAGLKPPPFAAEPAETTDSVMRAIRRRRRVVYTTPVWRWVMTVIRLLPRWLLRRSGI